MLPYKEAIALYDYHGSCFGHGICCYGLCFGTGASWRPRDALATFWEAGRTTRHSTYIGGGVIPAQGETHGRSAPQGETHG